MDEAHKELVKRLREEEWSRVARELTRNAAADALEALASEVERLHADRDSHQRLCIDEMVKVALLTTERDRLKAVLEGVCAIAYDHGSIAAIAHARKALGDAS